MKTNRTKQTKEKRANKKARETHIDSLTHRHSYKESHKNRKPEAVIYTQRACKVKKKAQTKYDETNILPRSH